MKTLSLLVLTMAVLMNAVHADIAYYNGSVTYLREGGAEHKTFACNEVLFIDVDTFDADEVFIFPAQKCYTEAANTFEQAIVSIGAAAKTVTILQYATINSGYTSGFATGKNSQLAVTDARIITTPRVLKYNSSLFETATSTSQPFYSQFSGLLSFNAKKTLANNAQGLSVYDAPTALINELTAKGYQRKVP